MKLERFFHQIELLLTSKSDYEFPHESLTFHESRLNQMNKTYISLQVFSSPFWCDSGSRASGRRFFSPHFHNKCTANLLRIMTQSLTNHRIKIHKKKLQITLCKNLSADIFVCLFWRAEKSRARSYQSSATATALFWFCFVYFLSFEYKIWNLKWN